MFYLRCIIIILFILTLTYSIKKEKVYENFGITKGMDKNKIYLTIDMCPSVKSGYNKDLFMALVDLSKKRHIPIPIAIEISGKWINHHKKELQEIKKLEAKKYIAITWVNHSYEHYYNSQDHDPTYSHNFMLHDKDNAINDIKKNEQVMKDNGLTPARFFRFPGLISDKYLNELVQETGLTILGSDAWLAKTEGQFKGGDIILIHGNLNEQKGIDLFLKNVRENKFNAFEFSPLENLCKEGLCLK